MKFIKRQSVFNIKNWQPAIISLYVIIALITSLFSISELNLIWHLIIGFGLGIILYILHVMATGLEGDIRESVISYKQQITEKNGHYVRITVPDQVKHQVKIEGLWTDIVKKKKE